VRPIWGEPGQGDLTWVGLGLPSRQEQQPDPHDYQVVWYGKSVEIEYFFIRKLQGMIVTPSKLMPILGKHLKGYVPNGRQLGIACNKSPDGIDQFTEVKVIHIGTVQNTRLDERDDENGSAAVNKFQGQARKSYLVNLKRKDSVHFGTS
jgi:hypothetical protein